MIDNNKKLNDSNSHLENSVVEDATRVVSVLEQNLSDSAVISIISGPEKWIGRAWPLTKNQTLGRNAGSTDISISELSLSRKHIHFIYKEDGIQVQDLNSTNGTFLNGQKLDAEKTYLLKNNDILKIGDLVFKFMDKGNVEGLSALRMQDQIYTDSLCQIWNRLFMDIKAREMFVYAQQYTSPLSFIVFDIDFFKKINDQYSHLAGDFILFSIADVVKNLIRQTDVFCRMGGEEFGLILECRMESAVQLAEKIRKKIENKSFQFKSDEIKITLSAGVSELKENDQNWKNLYERADSALYESKKQGRNQITAFK